VKEWIAGRNPVYETLRARRRPFFRLLIAKGVDEKGRLGEIQQLAVERRLTVEWVARQQIDSLAENHQGVALQAGEYPYSTLQDILALAKRRGEPPLILVLDVIQDPQNLGTLLRTSEAVGVHGVLMPLRRAAGVTPSVVHASAGACEHLLVAQLNLAQALSTLKEEGIWVAGLEGSPQARLPEEVRLDGPLAIVVGSEGEGLRTLVRQSCDFLIRLPMQGKIESLNAAVAGSVTLYLALTQRSLKQSKKE
jgi:23S rRNA (guanosine2251-2'-O)-methyltransferase